MSEAAENILTDNCSDDDGDHWLVPAEATNTTEAEIIINLGCMKIIKGLIIKNIKKDQGGTKMFTIHLAPSIEGPWTLILTDELKEQERYGCAPAQVLDLE